MLCVILFNIHFYTAFIASISEYFAGDYGDSYHLSHMVTQIFLGAEVIVFWVVGFALEVK